MAYMQHAALICIDINSIHLSWVYSNHSSISDPLWANWTFPGGTSALFPQNCSHQLRRTSAVYQIRQKSPQANKLWCKSREFFFLITAVSSRFFLQNLQNVIKKSVFWNTPTQLQGLAFCHAVIAQTHRGSRRYRAHLPDSAGNDLNMVNLIESSYIFTIPRRNMTILDT